MKKIPLIIPVYNQLTYLRNLINWWLWYNPDAPIFIVDNHSTYAPLLKYYESIVTKDIILFQCEKNDFIPNLTEIIKKVVEPKYEHYVISDPDIMPHPNTPPNFLDAFKYYIDNKGFHRAGFNLIVDDLPSCLNERAMIIGNEKELLNGREILTYNNFTGYKAPIDTTFCLYKTANGGWSAPMGGEDWGNCLRLFNAFHLGWYIDGEHMNPEMEHYFKTSKYRVPGEPSAGKNNNRPKQFQ